MKHVKRAEGVSVCWEATSNEAVWEAGRLEHDVELTDDPVISDCPRCLWMLISTTTEMLAAMAKRMEYVAVSARRQKERRK
jgi:hypothetical protein